MSAGGVPPVGAGVSPEVCWSVLAAGLAGQPRVRVGRRRRDGRGGGWRLDYDRERPLTDRLPVEPAAVRLYDASGLARTLALDFDPRPVAGRVETAADRAARVAADAAAAVGLLEACGARVVVDSSPRGGRHVWVPLAAPVSRGELEPVLRALAARFPATLDVGPALNVAAGCLRPPGAAHLQGGHQRLETPLPEAAEAVARRSAPGLLGALRARLGVAGSATPAGVALLAAGQPADGPDAGVVARPGGPVPLDPARAAIAATGSWPAGRFPSPSEARQSVLAGAAVRGWSLGDVRAAITSGAWSGLWSLYTRKWAEATAARQLARDWARALDYARAPFGQQPAVQADGGPVLAGAAGDVTAVPRVLSGALDTAGSPQSPTPTRGGTTHHRGGTGPGISSDSAGRAGSTGGSGREEEYRFLRRWAATWMEVSPEVFTGKAGYSARAVIWALAWAGQVTGSRYVEVGTRSLAVAGGLLDHSTVAAVLRGLRDRADAPVRLVREGVGMAADLYELVIPGRWAHVWDGRELPSGRLGRVDPVWSQIGLPEWCIWEAMRRGATGTAPELGEAAGVSRGEAYKALGVLAAHGLVVRAGQAWRRTRRTLGGLARTLGIKSLVAARTAAYAAERAAWRVVVTAARCWSPRLATDRHSGPPDAPCAAEGDGDGLWWPECLPEPPEDPWASPPPAARAPAAAAQVVAAAEELLIAVLGAVPA